MDKMTIKKAIDRAFDLYGITVDESTVRRAAASGRIDGAIREGYVWFVPEESFDRWLTDPEWDRRGRRAPKEYRMKE